ncbi:MAG: MFS transporter [Candidatus Binatia bacterium]
MFYGWWLVLVGLITQGLGAGGVIYAYSVLVLPLEHEFQTTRMAMMWGVTCSSLVAGLVSPWLGSLADRRPLHVLMAAGVVLMAAAFMVLSVTTAVWQVALCYALFMSFAQVLLGPLTAATLITRWFSRRRGLALGLAAVGTGIGGLVVPPVLQALITAYEWRGACRWFALLILAVALPPTLLVVSTPAEKGLRPDGEPGPPLPVAALAHGGAPMTTADIVRRFDFWAIALAVGIVFADTGMLLSNMMPYATGQGLPASAAVGLISTVAVAAVLGKLLFGAVADRIDLRFGLGAGMAVVCLALALFRGGSSAGTLRAASFALGLASGGILPLWGAMLGHAFGAEVYGRVIGLMSMAITVPVLLSPLLAGRIFDVTGAYLRVFEIFFVITLLVALLLPRLPPMRHGEG